jgi:RNA polymerase sigma factor (sigma-70 family)
MSDIDDSQCDDFTGESRNTRYYFNERSGALWEIGVSDPSSVTRILQGLLERLRNGDENARDELIEHACGRLVVLTRKMLGRFSRLRAWEETGDVAQNAILRLRRALEQVKPDSVREFMGLASVQIRRELLDLSRHYFGREGQNPGDENPLLKNAPLVISQAQGAADNSQQPDLIQAVGESLDTSNLEMWARFHEVVQNLSDVEREVVELLWYQELTQEEAAELLCVDKSTVKRRWRSARFQFSDALKGWLPESAQPEKSPPPD